MLEVPASLIDIKFIEAEDLSEMIQEGDLLVMCEGVVWWDYRCRVFISFSLRTFPVRPLRSGKADFQVSNVPGKARVNDGFPQYVSDGPRVDVGDQSKPSICILLLSQKVSRAFFEKLAAARQKNECRWVDEIEDSQNELGREALGERHTASRELVVA